MGSDSRVPIHFCARSRNSCRPVPHLSVALLDLDSIAAINDEIAPVRSSDTTQPRLSFWDHRGTGEWADLAFPRPAAVSRVRVFWFADRSAHGGCDLPHHWRLLYRDGDDWKPVRNASAYDTLPDRFNEVTFTRVRTTALRIEVELKPGWSAGICEWQVE